MNKDLIERLKQVDDEEILTLVTPDAARKGLAYHRNQFVEAISWDRGKLLVVVLDGDRYVVSVTLDSRRDLHFSCEHPIFYERGPLVAVALYTIANLLDPDRYHSLMLNHGKRKRLKEQFLTAEAASPTNTSGATKAVKAVNEAAAVDTSGGADDDEEAFESTPSQLFLEEDRYGLLLHYEPGTPPVEPPSQLQTLLYNPYIPWSDQKPILFDFFAHLANMAHPPELHLGVPGNAQRVHWDPEPMKICDLAEVQPDGEVAVKVGLFRDGEYLKGQALILNNDLAALLEANKLVPLSPGSIAFYKWAYSHYQDYGDEFLDRLELPISAINNGNVALPPEAVDSGLWLFRDEVQHPSEVTWQHTVSLKPNKEGALVASTTSRLEDDVEAQLMEEASLLPQNTEAFGIPGGIARSKAKKAVVRSAVFAIAQEPLEAARRQIREDAAADDIFDDGWSPEHVANFLFKVEQMLHTQNRILTINPETGWRLSESPLRTVMAICGCIEKTTDAEFSELQGGHIIKGERVMWMVPKMLAALRGLGVEVLLDDAALETSTVDLSVKVTRSHEEGQIDWFELRPEVASADQTIDPSMLARMLNGEFVTDDDGRLLLLSAEQGEMLEQLSLLRERHGDGSAKEEEEAFEVPRLAILDLLLLVRSDGVNIDMPPDLQKVIDSLMSSEGVPALPAPELNATLRDYQQAGFEWLHFLYEHRFGACLADDMGLGKTIQAIALMAHVHKTKTSKDLHLIVVPPSLVFNWAAEMERFCPSLRVHEYTGSKRALPKPGTADVMVTTYDLVRRDIEMLSEKVFDIVIFDEAQAVKTIKAARSKAVRQLQCRFKACLTGTPVENHAGEYFSIIDLALPGLLGSVKHFRASIKKGGGSSLPLRRAQIFVLRRTKGEILDELPPKVETQTILELSDFQRELYTRTVAEIKAEVEVAYAERPSQQAGIIALTAILRLRQLCVSPSLLMPDYDEVSPKLGFLRDSLEELAAEGHAALVFSQFTKTLDALEPVLNDSKVPFLRLDGRTPTSKRKDLVEAFQDEKGPPVFLISLKAGGVGLNLTRAAYVFHIDPWWNPAVENQATDRAHRIGQQHTVFVQRLIMRHSIEEKMIELKARKQELYDQIMQANAERDSSGLLTRADLDFLLDSLPS